jgi:hypothetical protein
MYEWEPDPDDPTGTWISQRSRTPVLVSITLNDCCDNMASLRGHVFVLGTQADGTTFVGTGDIDSYVRKLDAKEPPYEYDESTPGFISTFVPGDALSMRVSIPLRVYCAEPVVAFALILTPDSSASSISMQPHATGIDPFTEVLRSEEATRKSGELRRATVRYAYAPIKFNANGARACDVRFFVTPQPEYAVARESMAAPACYTDEAETPPPLSYVQPLTTVIAPGVTPAFEAANAASMRVAFVHILGGTAADGIMFHTGLTMALENSSSRRDGVWARPVGWRKRFDVAYIIVHDLLGWSESAVSNNKFIGRMEPARAATSVCMDIWQGTPRPGQRAIDNIDAFIRAERLCSGVAAATVVSRVFVGAGSSANTAAAALLLGRASSAIVIDADPTLIAGETRWIGTPMPMPDPAPALLNSVCCSRQNLIDACCGWHASVVPMAQLCPGSAASKAQIDRIVAACTDPRGGIDAYYPICCGASAMAQCTTGEYYERQGSSAALTWADNAAQYCCAGINDTTTSEDGIEQRSRYCSDAMRQAVGCDMPNGVMAVHATFDYGIGAGSCCEPSFVPLFRACCNSNPPGIDTDVACYLQYADTPEGIFGDRGGHFNIRDSRVGGVRSPRNFCPYAALDSKLIAPYVTRQLPLRAVAVVGTRAVAPWSRTGEFESSVKFAALHQTVAPLADGTLQEQPSNPAFVKLPEATKTLRNYLVAIDKALRELVFRTGGDL